MSVFITKITVAEAMKDRRVKPGDWPPRCSICNRVLLRGPCPTDTVHHKPASDIEKHSP